MEMTDSSARLLGKLMCSIKAEKENGLAVLLTLETEDNAREFFAWCKAQKKEPTPRECFEQAVKIRMKNGPDPEEEGS